MHVKAVCLRLIVLQLLKKLPAFYKTFTALYLVHKSPWLNLLWTKQFWPISSHCVSYFNIMFPSTPTKYYLHCKLWNKKCCKHFPFLTCVVQATCISHCFIYSNSANFKFMFVSCAKQINNCMTFNRYNICGAVVQWLGKDKDQLLDVSLSKKHIVDYYEVSGKTVIFVSELYLRILLTLLWKFSTIRRYGLGYHLTVG